MSQVKGQKRKLRPEQKQDEQPGKESEMAPAPKVEAPGYRGSYKLAKKSRLEFGSDVPMKRAPEPMEVAPAYVFLASKDSAYMTGQVLHVNGGEIING